MYLKPGQFAPSFHAVDTHGVPHTLQDYAGKHLLLTFLRFAGCPYCNLHTYALKVRYPIHQAAGLATIVIIESLPSYIDRDELLSTAPFPIIADPDGRLYDLYGAERDASAYLGSLLRRLGELLTLPGQARTRPQREAAIVADRLPAEFLISPDLSIRLAHYGQDFGDFLPFKDIDEALRLPYSGKITGSLRNT